MRLKIKSVMFIFLLLSAFSLTADPIISANPEKSVYEAGELITVKINVGENSGGFHSLFYDLAYDGALLTYEGLTRGPIAVGTGKLLYAHSDPMTSSVDGHHVVMAYRKDNAGILQGDGVLAELSFRVNTAAPGDQFFTFTNYGLKDTSNNDIPDVQWINGGPFSLITGGQTDFIRIETPYPNQVFHQEQAVVNLIGSVDSLYYALIKNTKTGEVSQPLSMGTGAVIGEEVLLDFGYNELKAELYNDNGDFLAEDSITVYRSGDDQFVKIISPDDHALVNSDMVDVRVASSFDTVEINGMTAEDTGEQNGDSKLFYARVWLKEGFNSITAVARSSEGLTYKNSIQVYYRKSNAIFKYISPAPGAYVKASENTNLLIKGEIDSQYSPVIEGSDNGETLNRVSFDIIYRPNDITKDTLTLFTDEEGVIEEAGSGSALSSSPYIFYNDFDIPLADLGNGEIEIIAYRNRNGSMWEDKIHRFIYIDNNHLKINLVQPNVFSYDRLDSIEKIIDFNGPDPIDPTGAVSMSLEGAFMLNPSAPIVTAESLSGAADIIETPRGVLYAMVNSVGGDLEIYKKEPGASDWSLVISEAGKFGYKLCYTGNGILAGVSNLYSSEDSGLYLLSGNELKNIAFPVELKHVQFIENRNDRIYLYGNYYSFLYYFDAFTLENIEGSLSIANVGTIPFENNDNIKQFILSPDLTTAVIRSAGKNVFYNKINSGYVRVVLPELAESSECTGDIVIPGFYSTGDYNSYLILKPGNPELIMESKNLPRRYFRYEITILDNLPLAAGFHDNDFYLLHEDSGNYVLNKGKFFFGAYYDSGLEFLYPATETISYSQSSLFVTKDDSFFIGAGTGLSNSLASSELYGFANSYQPQGAANFDYKNEDIDGITGFSFEIETFWLDSANSPELGFALFRIDNDNISLNYSATRLDQLFLAENDAFQVFHHYDASAGRERILVEFSELQKESYLTFDMILKALGSAAPEIYNFKVYKKLRAKICLAPGMDAQLPIAGYVEDRTVEFVTINGVEVPLGRDGSFHYDYNINSVTSLIPITVECFNNKESAKIEFTVEIVNSVNDIDFVSYKTDPSGISTNLGSSLNVTEENLYLSGKFYGLKGLIVGYEIYQSGSSLTEPVKRGVFSTNSDPAVFQDFNVDAAALGSGYESGVFADQEISLIPGKQSLLIYCENPGGLRNEYLINTAAPQVYYNLPENEQKIIFHLDETQDNVSLLTGETAFNTTIEKQIAIEAFETGASEFAFKRNYDVSGEIKSLHKFSDLIVKSFTEGLVFENGEQEIIVSVDSANRFAIPFTFTMGYDIERDFDIGVYPTIPFLAHLKTGFRVKGIKNFENTQFIPDFSSTNLNPDSWDGLGETLFKVKFNRNDIPLPRKMKLKLTLNHVDIGDFWLTSIDDSTYGLKNDLDETFYLEKDFIKTGVNRISWMISYYYTDLLDEERTVRVSSSASGQLGMSDYIFNYNPGDLNSGETEIFFSENLGSGFYNYETNILPSLNVSRDSSSKVDIYLNEKPFFLSWTDDSGNRKKVCLDLTTGNIAEGLNILTVKASDLQEENVFTFMFDSLAPDVRIESYKDSFTGNITDVTAVVEEANFALGRLYYGDSVINQHPEVVIYGEHKYLLKWTKLNLQPSTFHSLQVEAVDLAGASSFVSLFPEGDMERIPGVAWSENFISLPSYTGAPELRNEEGYENAVFSEHTKFAPAKFYRKNSLRDDESLDKEFELSEPFASMADDTSSYDYLGTAVAMDGDNAIVGQDGDDNEQGSNAGAVYFYKKDSEGKLKAVQKVIASDGAQNNHFGDQVDISGNFAIVGAIGQVTEVSYGAVYIYKMGADGQWTMHQKLIAPSGTMSEKFGEEIAISGDYIAVSMPYTGRNGILSTGVVFIYRRVAGDVWELETEILPEDVEFGSNFGTAIDLSGETLIASTRGSNGGPDDNPVYIFKRASASNWIQTAKLTGDSGGDDAEFGAAVSISGNYAFAGAKYDGTNGVEAGTVYIYKNDGKDNWSRIQKVFGSYTDDSDQFGYSVDVRGDYALVGAPIDGGSGAETRGRTYLFKVQPDGLWEEEQTLFPPAASGDCYEFGKAVAVSSAGFLIGAPKTSNYVGQIYYYNLNSRFAAENLLIANMKYQKIMNREEGRRFHGKTIDVSGDYAFIGSSASSDDYDNIPGSVDVYKRTSAGQWNYQQTLTASNASPKDYFGNYLSIDGDYAVIGATEANNVNGDNAGSAYIFKKGNDGFWSEVMEVYSGDGLGTNFGTGVSISGDNFVVGDSSKDRVYFYRRQADDTWIQVHMHEIPDASQYISLGGYNVVAGDYAFLTLGQYTYSSVIVYKIDENGDWVRPLTESGNEFGLSYPSGTISGGTSFGYNIAVSGDILVISDTSGIKDNVHTGLVHVYIKDQLGLWNLSDTLAPDDGNNSDYFGSSVDIDGEYIVVGNAYDDNDSGSNAGAAYVFKAEKGVWEQVQKIQAIDGDEGDKFGSKILLANDTIFISSTYDDNEMGDNAGSLYLYNMDMLGYSDDLIISTENNSHLIFKIEKSGSLTDIFGKIQFVVAGRQLNLLTNIEEETERLALVLDEDKYKYMEDDGYFYFIVDIKNIQEKFLEACASLAIFDSEDGYMVIDRGYMKYVCSENLQPSDIFVTGNSEDSGFDVNDVLIFDEEYLDPSSYFTGNDFLSLNPALSYDQSDLSAQHFNYPQLTLSFWVRPEDPAVDIHNYRRLFTFTNSKGEDLLNLSYKYDGMNFYDKKSDRYLLIPGNLIKPLAPGEWNLLVIKMDETENTLSVSINGEPSTVLSGLPSLLIADCLENQGYFRFGPGNGEEYNTGFYSIARPFYIDRIFTDEELKRLYGLKDQYSPMASAYYFDDFMSDFHYSDPDKFRNIGMGMYHTSLENHQYLDSGSSENGSFIGASERTDFLATGQTTGGVGYPLLSGASKYLGFNLESLTGTASTFILEPTASSTASFFMGDKNGNYNLTYDRWFSVSGEVIDIPGQDTEAKIVLRINGEEQSMILEEGSFHFIYDNKSGHIPYDVKLFIETDGIIELSQDMTFNEGNWILPSPRWSTAASTRFLFDLNGTVDLAYKPIAVNPEGFWSYPVTLVDSDFIKIGAEVREPDGDALYYALFKDKDGETAFKLETNQRLIQDWQQIQLSYSYEKQAVYFYVNHNIVAFRTGVTLPLTGSLSGLMPAEDNLIIGCDLEKENYAEGYISQVTLRRDFGYITYLVDSPFHITYDPDSLSVVFTNTKSNSVTDVEWCLTSFDGSIVQKGTSFPISLSSYMAGRYQLETNLTYEGLKHRDILNFNIDHKPRFFLRDNTPIIFSDVSTTLDFRFSYDRSHQFQTDSLLYAGVGVKLTLDTGETETRYIVQNFSDSYTSRWLISRDDGNGGIGWLPLEPNNGGFLNLPFEEIRSGSDVDFDVKTFYFVNDFSTSDCDFNGELDYESFIPQAAIQTSIALDSGGYEYKLVVEVPGGGDGIVIDYYINREGAPIASGSRSLSDETAEFYYDDVLPSYGNYECSLEMKYEGVVYAVLENLLLSWEQQIEEPTITEAMDLGIEEFSMLFLDKENDIASFYLKYFQTGIQEFTARVYVMGTEKTQVTIGNTGGNSYIFRDIPMEKGVNKVKVTLEAEGIIRSQEMEVSNTTAAPDVRFTNSVESLIAYNNIYLSWIGYYESAFNSNIEYQYNLDDTGWTTYNNQWRNVRFYNLAEGSHEFLVRGSYQGVTSAIRSVSFFVDTGMPVFDPLKIRVEKIYDAEGIFSGVNIIGEEGAVSDISLSSITLDDEFITLGEGGSFLATGVPVPVDGINRYRLTAYDRVGNYTDHIIEVDNTITRILFPEVTESVKYAPVTLVGTIDSAITAGMEIFVLDPYCETRGENDYSSWKKARINEDRTFFVEDLLINPGTRDKELVTTLKLAVRFNSGKVFTKDIDLRANGIIMPIELSLSSHAVEGENSETAITIDCKANVERISSWSIDFNGDGIYDDISLGSAQDYTWSHAYSSLGMVNPRVRVVTTDGHWFSVADSLIIHEKIKEASHKMVSGSISMDILPLEDRSKQVFVLQNKGSGDVVNVYSIPRNEDYLTDKLFTVNLDELGLENCRDILVAGVDHIYIASNTFFGSKIHELKANMFGNYEVLQSIELDYTVRDMSSDGKSLLVSFNDSALMGRIQIAEGHLDNVTLEYATLELRNTLPLEGGNAFTKDAMGILVADSANQRIVRFTDGLMLNNLFGSIGVGEKEFLDPSIIKSKENRIFVYDKLRKDIQVFDGFYKPLCTLDYNTEPGAYNYLEPGFFSDLADISIVTRSEGNRLYYYALLLSRSNEKMALLRLPQWEELRARIRNNKIVFIRDGELFTAKPEGSDLTRILSTDSIPRISGALDYPALSPDGRNLVFTSRRKLYNGEYHDPDGNIYAYDNVYVVNVENHDLKMLPLGNLQGYEIERPVFNSNGDKLIFSARENGANWQIYVYGLETGLIEKLFDSDENARFPYYSPDDRFVVFSTDYDGDEEIEVIDTENPSMRIRVTSNNSRDSYPVWNTVYPFEIPNKDLKIESKIAFVSERNFHKGVHYLYIARKSDSDIRVVTKSGEDIGSEPDVAAIEVTTPEEEGDYPCFTGDGTSLFFEYFNGENKILRQYDFENDTLSDKGVFENTTRPGGMKNMITNFSAENRNGDEIILRWNRYTENDIFYTVQFRVNREGEPFVEKRVFSQTGTILKGLEMGKEYLVRVCIYENDEEVTTSRWLNVLMPEVVARPSIEIDENNPYLVYLNAWKPEPDTNWRFTWIIDNQEYPVQSSQDYLYEFATGGIKTIALKTSNAANTATNYSAPVEVNIITDIKPVIEYNLAEDRSYIELSCENSMGKKIDYSTALWTISGPGGIPIQIAGSNVIVQLNDFEHKINVSLGLSRYGLNGQVGTDRLESSITVDLDMSADYLVPVIMWEASGADDRLITFNAQNSIGNIDWDRARWTIFADDAVIHREEGTSSFVFLFPPRNSETTYTITLVLTSKNGSLTKTVSRVLSVEESPVEPKIDYEVLVLKEGTNVTGAKLMLDCSQSLGSGIDWAQAKWSLPVAAQYGDQAVQYGPTAVFNLTGFENGLVVEAALTLTRHQGKDPMTITKLINVSTDKVPSSKAVVTPNIEKYTEGTAVYLDVLKSSGPNILWEQTEWLIDGQYSRKGASVRVDIPTTDTKQVVQYSCILYRTGMSPEKVTGSVDIGQSFIRPLIGIKKLSGTVKNAYELNVLDTEGANIDWERTTWYIHDASGDVAQKYGSSVSHSYRTSNDLMGYPVIVEMFFKGSSRPFIAYTTIDVEGDELQPIITYDESDADPNVLSFYADSSLGSNINWGQAKWSFGDSSESQYGANVSHRFPIDSAQAVFRVTLTLSRTLPDGTTELKRTYQDIDIAEDVIKPVIRATYKDNYLVLSSENSTGRGLMLDRTMWLFDGKGDSSSVSATAQSGVLETSSHTNNHRVGAGITAGITANFGAKAPSLSGGPFFNAGVSLSTTVSYDYTSSNMDSSTNYDDLKSDTDAYSTTNSHSGAVCRRYIEDDSTPIMLTMFVYKITKDGGMVGESLTISLKPSDASEEDGKVFNE